ncbi:hypothetical protein [Actinokineospora iranica]|uniref:Uncharacterized protein n=1 Tax=Actinokineospora iranica TaxID=1271860 RepID=A0A1G6RX65_9PSEU|nr:hypothetical protein [Actinokineospora iranica]SDD09179.1 hypothetical protein SAMN05216174_10780 [Actinokineospora iranica]
MDLTAPGAHGVRAAATPRTAARGMPTAMALLAGSVLGLVGLTWDVQWHTDVGPDTFFTLPHLFIYAGSALSGLAALVAVLGATAAARAGRPLDPTVGGASVGVFGRTFTAPVGYLISGVGAAVFLLYGMWDLWWHGVYGFDAVIDSPPHIGLLLSGIVTMVGTIMVFAAAAEHRWGRVGTDVSIALTAANVTITVLGLTDVGGPVDAVHTAMAWLVVILLLTAAGFRPTRGGAVIMAGWLAVIQAVTWWFSPWAAYAYADAVGLPVRDYINGVPVMPALMPMALIAVALLIEPILKAARAHGNRWLPVAAGAVAGALVAALQGIQDSIVYTYPTPGPGTLLPTAVAGALLGALAGHLGWRFGHMLRLVNRTRPEGN